jgi:hypothetical protein
VDAEPSISRTVWDNSDFESMGWHDNVVHAIAFEPLPTQPGRLMVDLDYIVGAACPVPPSKTVIFWVCPATLVFDDAADLTCDIDMRGWGFRVTLMGIKRAGPDPHGRFEWTLTGWRSGFEVSLVAPNFRQYLRRPPVEASVPWLSLVERGGLSFDEKGYGD